jgi:hypothetical protein
MTILHSLLAVGLVVLLLLTIGCSDPGKTASTPPGPTQTSQEVQSLDEYLSTTLEITAEYGRQAGGLTEIQQLAQRDLSAFGRAADAYVRFTDEALASLASLSPPPEAAAYHDGVQTMLMTLADSLGSLAAAIEEKDTDGVEGAALRMISALALFGEVAEQEQELIITALLKEPTSAITDYLIDSAELRRDFSSDNSEIAAKLQQILTNIEPESAQELFGLLEQGIALQERFQLAWNNIAPPPEARELHERQAALNAKQIGAARQLLAAYELGDPARIQAARNRNLENSLEASLLAADWNDFIVVTLSR